MGGPGANGGSEIGFAELKKLRAVEVAAACQCAGNRRGLFQPHVAGVQWGHGAIGCARWKGARFKDVLDLVGLKKDVVEIVFDGADGPAIDRTPDFLKAFLWKAIEETTLVAYEMNGEPLPPITEIVVGARNGGTEDGHKRDRMGWRLWPPLGRNLGRQWKELDASGARSLTGSAAGEGAIISG